MSEADLCGQPSFSMNLAIPSFEELSCFRLQANIEKVFARRVQLTTVIIVPPQARTRHIVDKTGKH